MLQTGESNAPPQGAALDNVTLEPSPTEVSIDLGSQLSLDKHAPVDASDVLLEEEEETFETMKGQFYDGF